MSLIPTPQQMELSLIIDKLQAENAELREELQKQIDNVKNVAYALEDAVKERAELKARIDGGIRVYVDTVKLSSWVISVHLPISNTSNALLILDEGTL